MTESDDQATLGMGRVSRRCSASREVSGEVLALPEMVLAGSVVTKPETLPEL
jgi:hypothetical protein